MAYGYDKLGDKATSQQYVEILKLNYPNLVKSNGEVNLRAARNEGSWWNKATLGILGQKAESTATTENRTVESPDTTGNEPSWINRMSFGLLDRPDQTIADGDYAPAGESLYDKQRPQN